MGVMATGIFSSDLAQTCLAVSGDISLCNPGGGAYFDTNVEYIDDYLAEFDWESGSLEWSTLFGGTTDEEASVAVDRYNGMNSTVFEVNRFMDLRTDPDDNILVMGLSAQRGATEPADFETVAGWGGMYNKPFDPGMGDSQTEITLAMFSPTKQLLWLSMFGGQFPHIEIGEPGFVDWDLLHLGCDFGRDLVYFPEEVLYVAGCSGGLDFVRSCPYPYPGPSYCEDENPLLAGSTDRMDGFITRFNMQNVGVHIAEEDHNGAQELLLYPSPAQDILYFTVQADQKFKSAIVEIDNALGQLVRRGQLTTGNSVPVGDLAPGLYFLRLTDTRTGYKHQGRFQIQ